MKSGKVPIRELKSPLTTTHPFSLNIDVSSLRILNQFHFSYKIYCFYVVCTIATSRAFPVGSEKHLKSINIAEY